MPSASPFARDPKHVLRIARTFEAVYHDDCQGVLAIHLPMTMDQNFDSGLDFN